jgi:hypothetical protein
MRALKASAQGEYCATVAMTYSPATMQECHCKERVALPAGVMHGCVL